MAAQERRRYLGLARGPGGLRGCLLEDTPDGFGEPRPLYLELTPRQPLLDNLSGPPPDIAWCCPPPPGWGSSADLHLPPEHVRTLLQLADHQQRRPYRAAHLAAWLAWRERWGYFPQSDEILAWEWVDHLARSR